MNPTLSLTLGPPTRSTFSYDPAASALIARMTTPPSTARALLINDVFLALRAAGLLTKLEALYFLAAADSQAALLNWISTSFNATEVNAPTFTADRGYAGNATTSYLDTGWNPSSSSLFTQNSGAIASYVNAGTDTASNTPYTMGVTDGSANLSAINARGTGDVIRGMVNRNAVVNFAGISSTTHYGFTAVSRTAAAVTTAYRGTTPSTVSTSASTGRPNANLFICGVGNAGALNSGSNLRVAMASMSSGLTDTEMAALYNAALPYLTAVGAS